MENQKQNEFENLLFEKLNQIDNFKNISKKSFLERSKNVKTFLKDEHKPNFESLSLENWAPVLSYLSFKYGSVSAANKKVIGLQGPQGSGKSTISRIISNFFKKFVSLRCESVSIDDFYLTYDERKKQGIEFRGPPGTHDLDLLNQFYSQFSNGKEPGGFDSRESELISSRVPPL